MQPSTDISSKPGTAYRMSSVSMLLRICITFVILAFGYGMLRWLTSGFTKLLFGYVVPVTLPAIVNSFFALVAGIVVFRVFMLWYNTYFMIYPPTIGRKWGVFSKESKYTDAPDWKITAIKQSFFGKIFNYGSIVLYSESSQKSYELSNLHDPNQKQLEIMKFLSP